MLLGQKCLQPGFAESDRQFRRNSTLHSAAVAVIRSANERAVRIMKQSWKLKNGVQNGATDVRVLADLWLAWGFQVNFMFSPIVS